MSGLKAFEALKSMNAPRVAYNTGTMLDVANGRFMPDKKGNSMLDGGLASISSFFGKTQTYKSTVMCSHVSRILANYPEAQAFVWENENSIQDASRFDDLAGEIVSERVGFLGLSQCEFLEEFDAHLKTIIDERIKNKKDYMLETPFLDMNGKPIYQMSPFLVCIDSFTAANTLKVWKEFGQKDLSDPKQNRAFMVEGGVKTAFTMKLPKIIAQAGITFFSSGHLAEDKAMASDPMAKFDTAITPNMKQGDKVNRVGSQWLFLSNNAIEAKRVNKLLKDRNTAIYGVEGLDRSDLNKIKCVLTKGKSRQGSGFEVEHVCSNIYGIDPAVEAFEYVRDKHSNIFGSSAYKLEPVSGTKFTNNQLREKSQESAQFSRAIQLIGQYAFLKNIWVDYKFPLPSLEEFTDGLANCNQTLKDEIVNSTGVWQFKSNKNQKKLMSVLDVMQALKKDGALKSKD